MRRLAFILMLLMAISTARAQDTVYRTVIGAGYLPTMDKRLFGVGVYAHGLLYGVGGFYCSITGLYEHQTGSISSTDGYYFVLGPIAGPKIYQNISIGVTIRAVEGFYFYCGFSKGDYQQFYTTYYSKGYGNTSYTFIEEKRGSDPGIDCGAIYYAGKKLPRFGLSLGFNTSTRMLVAGLHFAIGIPRLEW